MGVNYLQTAVADRPDLPTRSRAPGAIEVKCPTCGKWRPAFTLNPAPPGSVSDWYCDIDITIIDRTV